MTWSICTSNLLSRIMTVVMRTLNTLPSGSDGKERVCHAGDPGLIPGLGRSPGRKWLPTPVFLPGESHGQRSLVGYHSWGLRCLPSVSHSTRCSIRSFMCPTVHLTHCTVLLSFSFIKMVNSLELISLNTVIQIFTYNTMSFYHLFCLSV